MEMQYLFNFLVLKSNSSSNNKATTVNFTFIKLEFGVLVAEMNP